MENIVLEELLKKAKSLGYPTDNYNFENNILIIIGERRSLLAYTNGKWFSVEEAKRNASLVRKGARRPEREYERVTARSYNGIVNWLSKFEYVSKLSEGEKVHYVSRIIILFIQERGESVRKDKSGRTDIIKASNLISTRWGRFKEWYLNLIENG